MTRTTIRSGAVAWALVLLAACTGVPLRPAGEVSVLSLEPEDAQRHPVANDEDFRVGQPLADTRALPAYPPQWLEHAPVRLRVCVELNVDESGSVTSVRPLREIDGCDTPSPEMAGDFDAAVRDAVSAWRFAPSLVCRLAPAAPAEGTCEDVIDVASVAILRAYRFVFRREGGGAVGIVNMF